MPVIESRRFGVVCGHPLLEGCALWLAEGRKMAVRWARERYKVLRVHTHTSFVSWFVMFRFWCGTRLSSAGLVMMGSERKMEWNKRVFFFPGEGGLEVAQGNICAQGGESGAPCMHVRGGLPSTDLRSHTW